jgi:hypothetical protein
MIFDQVTNAEMQAARILTGVTMAAFLAARLLGGQARTFRIVIAGTYIAGVSAFAFYLLL